MQPIVLAMDSGKPARRMARAGAFLGIGLLLAALATSSFESLLFWFSPLLLLAVVVLWTVWLVAPGVYTVFWPQRADNWLRVDGDGVTLSRQGRETVVRWSEIGEIVSHRWFHPALLVRGRFLTLHGAGGKRGRFLPRLSAKLALADAFFTNIAIVAEALTAARRQAGTASPANSEPDLFRVKGYERPHGTIIRYLLLGVAGLSVFALGMFILEAYLLDNWGWLQGERPSARHISLSVLSLGAPVVFWARGYMYAGARSGNLVLLDSAGLHLRRNGERKHWLWSDIASLALDVYPADAATGAAGARFLTVTAAHDGHGPALLSRGPKPERIDDIYDAPIDEIAQRVEAWRAAAEAA